MIPATSLEQRNRHVEHFIDSLSKNKYYRALEVFAIAIAMPGIFIILLVGEGVPILTVMAMLAAMWFLGILFAAITALWLAPKIVNLKETCDDPGCLCVTHIQPRVFDYEDERWILKPCDDGSCSCIEHTDHEQFVDGKWGRYVISSSTYAHRAKLCVYTWSFAFCYTKIS